MKTSAFSSSSWLALINFVLMSCYGMLQAQQTTTQDLTSVTFEGNNILMDSDLVDGNPSTNRHTLDAKFTAFIQVRDSPIILFDYIRLTAHYRIRYQLIDDDGVALPLVNGDPSDNTTAFTPSVFVDIDSGGIFITGTDPMLPNSASPTFMALPDPVATLDVEKQYRVEGTLQRSNNSGATWADVVGETETTQLEEILHFTNTSSADAAYNIRGLPTALSWTRTVALDTDSNEDAFQANMGAIFARYDGFNAAVNTVNTNLIFDFDIIEVGTGNSIPLLNDGVVTVSSVPAQSHNGGTPRDYSLVYFNAVTADLKPLQQLKSGSETYTLRCTLKHIEDPLGTEFTNAVLEIAPQRLLHFNGGLTAGTNNTIVKEFSNIPTPGTLGANYVNTVIQIGTGGATILGRPDVVFGNNSNLSVRLFDDGRMLLISGIQTAFLADFPGAPIPCPAWPGMTYTSISIGNFGFRANGYMMKFPQGLVYFPDLNTNRFAGQPSLTQVTTITLDAALCPPDKLQIPLGADAAIADESHPLLLGVSQMELHPSGQINFSVTDSRYTHQDAFGLLRAKYDIGQYDSFEMTKRCSNDRYYLNLSNSSTSAVIDRAIDGTARLNVQVKNNGGRFSSHFPKKTEVSYSDSAIVISDGAVSTANGALLANVPNVKIPYYQTCSGDDCTSAIPPVVVEQIPANKELHFTEQGGLYAPSEAIDDGAGHELEWGKRSATTYAHRTDEFSEGNFYMPGYQLYATDNTLINDAVMTSTAAENAPGALLLSGFNEDLANPKIFLAPDNEYREGVGSLPGLTFEVTDASHSGASRLAGASSDYGYDLLENQGNGGSKYYIRESGVSGRQVGRDGSYDSSLILHGFSCKISQFQLSFLENTNEANGCTSWVDGVIQVKGYSNWDQAFTGMRFDCLGEPGEMTPDFSDADGKSLSYWNSSFDLKSLYFITYEDPPGSCPKKFKAKLAAGAKTRVSHIDQDLFGTLAFSPDGNLSNLQNALDFPDEFDGIDSQLRIPANIPLTGPNKDYNLVSTSKLRFNNPTASGSPGSGFVTFAATIDIPYFKDLQVQAITTASDSPGAPFALTPGWNEGGNTWFNLNHFDPNHRGFPPSGISYDQYRDPKNAGTPVSEAYLIKAEQDLFGFIPLSYPLFWDDNTRRFASSTPRKQDIFVAQMEHKIDWMDAKFTNISFGATYDGLPQLKLSNWLNGQIDTAAAAISDELGSVAKEGIDLALGELEKMLEDTLEQLINPLVDTAAGTQIDPGPIRDIYRLLYQTHLTVLAGSNSYNDFRAEVEMMLNNPSDFLFNAIPELAAFRDHLCLIADTGGDVTSFLTQIEEAIEDIIKGIDYITTGVENAQNYELDLSAPDAATVASNGIKGLLYKNTGGERELINSLIDVLLVELVEPNVRAVIQPLLESVTSELNAELNTLLEDIDATLDTIKEVLLQVRGFLVEAHGLVQAGNDIAQQFVDMVTDAKDGGLLNGLLRPCTTRAWSYFQQIEQALGIPHLIATGSRLNDVAAQFFASFTEDQFVQLLKDEIKNAIMESDIVQETQFLLRQTLYDIADKVTSALQSVLAEMTNVMKEVISDTIGALEDEINPLLGEVSKYMGSGEITGYAEFNGDSLRKLRLDAKMQFEIPEEMALHVYLEILCYSSEDNFVESGCVKPGEKVVEVRIGAKDVSVEWISECKINLEVKLTLKDYDGEGGVPPLPIGVGGTFELADGEIDFEAFKILEFGATIGVGLEECYIGAKARAIFSNYQVAAGIFFGRTCTLEPLLFVDPDIGDVVTAGTTFTGAYVYGEVWLPISELVLGVPASCLFRIDAGVGAGAFYFLEGPTYGGKIFLGVSGEALCVVSIGGEIKIILASQAGVLRGAGNGKFYAKIGWCPFCIKFSKSIKLLYDENNGWSMQ